MIDRPAGDRQVDLLVRAANTLDPIRIPPQIRTEIASLLKLLMAEHIATGGSLPREAADE